MPLEARRELPGLGVVWALPFGAIWPAVGLFPSKQQASLDVFIGRSTSHGGKCGLALKSIGGWKWQR